MELQTRIEKLETSLNRQKLINIALAGVIVLGVGVAAIQPASQKAEQATQQALQATQQALQAAQQADQAFQQVGNATFDTITCKAWKVVDKDGKQRIGAATFANGEAGVQWLDKDEKARIEIGRAHV